MSKNYYSPNVSAVQRLSDLLKMPKVSHDMDPNIRIEILNVLEGVALLDKRLEYKAAEVQNRDSILVQKEKNLKEIKESINSDEQKQFIKILPKIYPNDYPVKFENWRPDIWGKQVINRNDVDTIKKYLPGFKVELLKRDFIDILTKLYPNDYPVDFKNWRSDIWGKQVINNNDIHTIEKNLPIFKIELLKKDFIDILPKIYPNDYPKRFEDWRPDSWGKQVINRDDIDTIKHWLPIYKDQLSKQLLVQQEHQRVLLANRDQELVNTKQELEKLKELLAIKEAEKYELSNQNKNTVINEIFDEMFDNHIDASCQLSGNYIEHQNDSFN